MRLYYPICLDLRGRHCLVVGGGEVAQRKVEGLLRMGASVRVVAVEVTDSIAKLARQKKVHLARRAFQPSDLAQVFLVIAATDQPQLHRKISGLCQRKNILLNVVDTPQLCNFIVPSILRRGNLMVAVSTNGASPAFSKKIRQDLEKHFGKEYGVFLKWMEQVRPKVARRFGTSDERKAVFKNLVASPVLELLAKGKEKEARRIFKEIALCRSK